MAEQQLADMLAVPLARARDLLRQSGGEIEGAVALHFANPGGRPQEPQSPRTELCALLGGSVTQQQAAQLLRRSGNSIAAAADLYFEDPAAAGPAGGADGAAAARHRGNSSDPITMSDGSEHEDTEDSDAGDGGDVSEEVDQPGRRRIGMNRPSAGRGGRGRGGRSSGGRSLSGRSSGGRGAQPVHSTEGHGLVRSPRAMGTVARLAEGRGAGGAGGPGGMGALLAQLLGGPLFGGDPDESDSEYGESDSEGYGYGGYGYSEEEDEELPPTPRLGPKLTEQMPDLNSAAAGWTQARMLPAAAAEAAAQQAGPSTAAAAAAAAVPAVAPAPTIAPELLPLAHMRLDGKLFTDNQDLVPAVVRPVQPMRFPLKLGTIVLPLATLNEDKLKATAGKQHWTALEWGGKSKLFHNYVGPGNVFRQLHLNQVAKPLPLSELAGWGFPVQQLEQQARLALYGRQSHDDVALATVREEHTWVSELLYSLWVLETAGIADIRCQLVAEHGQHAEEAQQAQQQDAAQQQAGQQQEPGQQQRSPSPGPAEQQQQQQGDAGGSGGAGARSRSKGRSKSREAPAAADGEAGPSSKGRGRSKSKSKGKGKSKSKSKSKSRTATPAPDAAVMPRGVRLEVVLTQNLQHQLWYDGEDGDLTDQMEDKKGVRKITARGAQAKWTKNGTALGRVVSALLQFGSGLSLGPDADGLLNLGDVPAHEWREVAEPPPAQRRAMFDVERLLDSVAYKRQGLTAPAPRGLATTPKQYQLSGLQWMLNREAKGDALGRGQLRLHPAWLQLVAEDGKILYLHRLRPHVASPNFYSAPVGGTCGGFLVDEMGLGKTLQTLMLVLSNPPPAGWAVKRLEGLVATEESEAVPIKTSLIVVPANLLGQWAEEIERHVAPGRLSWARYLPPGVAAAAAAGQHAEEEEGDVATRTRRSRRVAAAGGTVNLARGDPVRPVLCRTPDGQLKPMHELDVVLMSYEQLRDQLYASGSHTSLLAQFGFWRVVLDEAQLVANSSSVAAVMASSLWRRHAWVVTGTPISNKLDEIKGLLEFLAAEPYHHAPVWRGLLQSSYEAQSVGGLLSLRSLLRGVMLRRSKADVAGELELPPCTREDKWVPLSSVERLCYEQSRRAFCDAAYQVQQQHGGGIHANRARHTSKAVGRALAAFTGLRQSCCHPQIVRRIVDDVLGKERKSMRDIMGALVVKAYGEWDQAARRLVDAKLIEAAVAAGAGAHPEEALRPVMELIRANQLAASSSDIRGQATSNRRMFAEVADTAQGAAAAANGTGDGAGTSAAAAAAAAAAQAAGSNGQLAGGAAADDKGKAPMQAEPPQQQQQPQPPMTRNGRKRQREESEGPSSAAAARGSPQQQQDGGAAAEQAAAAGNTDQQLAEAMQAEEDAAAAEQQAPSQEEKEAAARLRAWRKLELDALELYAHMLKNIGSKPKGKAGKGKGKAQQQQQQQQQQAQEAAVSPPAKRPRRGEAAATAAGGSQPAAAEAGGNAAAEAAAAGGAEQPIDKAVVQAQLESTLGQIEAVRAELRLRADGLADGQLMRRSRRRAGVDVDEEVFIDMKEAQEQLLNAKVILRAYTETLGRRDPEKSARTTVRAAEKECQDTWHHLQHMLNKEGALLAADKGKGPAEEGDGAADGNGAAGQAAVDVEQADLNSCPICLDDLSTRTITSCGHHYCPPCIREVLAHGNRTCPICRTPLREEDLFDAVSEEEARLNAAVRSAADGANADFGAKVSMLLSELAAMRAADPGAKAVVFSSWGRLLKLVGNALDQNGVRHATLAGANPAQREDALHAFLHDPDCVVLTVVMSTSGGAAGLTLTVAHTAFLLEPSLNPGLEAQAAARICRLGQTQPTRVVRLLAQDSVERQVLEVQRRKLERGDVPESGATALADVDAGMLLQIYEAVK